MEENESGSPPPPPPRMEMRPASKRRTVYGFHNSSHGEARVRPGYSTTAVTATKTAITGIQGHCLCVEKKKRMNYLIYFSGH